jgi:hypothetical protein
MASIDLTKLDHREIGIIDVIHFPLGRRIVLEGKDTHIEIALSLEEAMELAGDLTSEPHMIRAFQEMSKLSGGE